MKPSRHKMKFCQLARFYTYQQILGHLRGHHKMRKQAKVTPKNAKLWYGWWWSGKSRRYEGPYWYQCRSCLQFPYTKSGKKCMNKKKRRRARKKAARRAMNNN